jgi:polyphosphate glucokinase
MVLFVGDATRKKIRNSRWNKRVRRVITAIEGLVSYDHLYIGGGNSERLIGNLGPNVTLIDRNAGILGGFKVWDSMNVDTT